MEPAQQRREGLSRAEWTVVALLVASVFINYIDRSNLAIAAPVLEKELSFSPLQMGALLSAFSWTYALLQLGGLAGWISDRFPVGRVIAWGYTLWCAATAVTGLLSSFTLLYTARLVLGAGESIAYPCYSRIFAGMPQAHRGRANALIDAGTKIGPALGALIGGVLLIHFGWRVLFVALGVVGMLWLIPWIRIMPAASAAAFSETERKHAEQDEAASPSTRQLLTLRPAWGSFLGLFCGNYFFYFLLTWLPVYLVRERGLSLAAMSRLTFAVFAAIATATVTAGWVSDRWIAHGISPTVARKSIAVGGMLVATTLSALAFTHSLSLTIALLFVASIGYGSYASNHWAISQTLAGPIMAGRWTGIQNGIGNLSGIVAPWLAGAVVEKTGSSRAAFLVTGLVAMAGAIFWQFLVPRVEEVQWKRPARLPAAQ